MLYTENLKLKKPELSDLVNIGDFNDNTDILDSAIHKLQNKELVFIKKMLIPNTKNTTIGSLVTNEEDVFDAYVIKVTGYISSGRVSIDDDYYSSIITVPLVSSSVEINAILNFFKTTSISITTGTNSYLASFNSYNYLVLKAINGTCKTKDSDTLGVYTGEVYLETWGYNY